MVNFMIPAVVFLFNIVASHPSAEGCDATDAEQRTYAGNLPMAFLIFYTVP